MTAGEDALREAARLETARIYSQLQREHRNVYKPGPALAVPIPADDIDVHLDRRVVTLPLPKADQRGIA